MKTTITTLILLLIFSINSFACECSLSVDLRILDKESYEYSDIVLIGDVVKTGANYRIKVIEVLKGNVENSIISGTLIDEEGMIDSCSYFPSEKGKYLFYLNEIVKNEETFYLYSQCGGTRKLNLDIRPLSLISEKSKTELIAETENWIDELRKRKK